MKKPIAFFAHHQGRGHANRIMAIAEHFSADRQVSVLTAGPDYFESVSSSVEVVALPNMIGALRSLRPAFDAQDNAQDRRASR
jgi:UDP-N-acetylglucosamine--N-acetylmuramyl-(pentapeptide) pyrophosphoryl-undecaprenol N-acetylglucosamine transferase